MRTPRVIAIDWSGAQVGARRKIWLAEAVRGRVVRLEDGRHRDEIEQHLVEEAERDPHLVIGLDFAFSMPAWFLRAHRMASAHELWSRVAAGAGEAWLAACDPPLWGRPGRKRPAFKPDRPARRKCESGIGAKEVFQVGGAGAVGTGSLRGIPMLHRLCAAGFHIWPYDDVGWPLVVEIYPRLYSGGVVKSDAGARAAHCRRYAQDVPTRFIDAACRSEDAFDALFSALAMSREVDELSALPAARDALTRIEGAIWQPQRELTSREWGARAAPV